MHDSTDIENSGHAEDLSTGEDDTGVSLYEAEEQISTDAATAYDDAELTADASDLDFDAPATMEPPDSLGQDSGDLVDQTEALDGQHQDLQAIIESLAQAMDVENEQRRMLEEAEQRAGENRHEISDEDTYLAQFMGKYDATDLSGAQDPENYMDYSVADGDAPDAATIDTDEYVPDIDYSDYNDADTDGTSHLGTTADAPAEDEQTLDELLASLKFTSASAASTPPADASYDGFPMQVPKIEDLWQELGTTWPVIERSPEVVAKIEELWRRLKQAHDSGVSASDISNLFQSLAGTQESDSVAQYLHSIDDTDDATDNTGAADRSSSGEVADIVRRILAGAKAADIADDIAQEDGTEPSAAGAVVESDDDAMLRKYFSSLSDEAEAPEPIPGRQAARPGTGKRGTAGAQREHGISAEEKAILQEILGDNLDQNIVQASDVSSDSTSDSGSETLDEKLKHILQEANITDDVIDMPAVNRFSTKDSAGKSAKSSAGGTASKPVKAQTTALPQPQPMTAGATPTTSSPEKSEGSYLLPLGLAAAVILTAGWIWMSMFGGDSRNSANLAQTATTTDTPRKKAQAKEKFMTPEQRMEEFRRSVGLDDNTRNVAGSATIAQNQSSRDRGSDAGGSNRYNQQNNDYTTNSNSTTENYAYQADTTYYSEPAADTGFQYDNTYTYQDTTPQSAATGTAESAAPLVSQQPDQASVYTSINESLSISTQNIQNLVDDSLDRLRTSTQSGLQDLSQRVNRLEDVIGQLQQAIESLLRQSDAARSDQSQNLARLEDRLVSLETTQKEAFNASIERDKEGVTIVITEPGSDPYGDGRSGGTISEVVHTVVKGDTLWDIAAKYINDPFRYPELARLSKIKNPDLIYPGDRVKIIRRYLLQR